MPKLIYHDSDGQDKILILGSEPVLVGRATECQVQTQDAMVSRRHARIYWDGNYWIEDLGSSNGVYVGNDKVHKAPFRPGDTVTCGSLVLRMVPDTTPRVTGNMAATPPVGSPSLGAPPPAAPPMPSAAPPPMAPPPATLPPPAALPRGEVQIGPNAVLRGAVLPSHATTGAQASLADELRQEKQRRQQAEAAVLDAAERLRNAEARVAELEALTKEATLLKRKLDQAQADLRRVRGGGPAVDEATRDEGEAATLRARVAELEQQLRRPRAGGSEPIHLSTAAPRPSADPAAADAAIALGDSLAELRASLRAANDEAGLLTAPPESVEVVGEALRSAAEQLEAARAHLRALGKLLGVS